MMTGNFQKSKDSNNTFNSIKYILISVRITVNPEYHTKRKYLSKLVSDKQNS